MDENEEKDEDDLPIPHQAASRVLATLAGLAASLLVRKVYLKIYFRDEDDQEDE